MSLQPEAAVNDQQPAQAPATRADITEIFRNFSSIFDQKLANVQTQFLETQQQTANSLQSKIKETQKAKWKREGNQKQFEHNQQVSAKC